MFELVQVFVWVGYGLYLFLSDGVPIISLKGLLFFIPGPILAGYVLGIPLEIAILRVVDRFTGDEPGFFGWHVLSALVTAFIVTRLGYYFVNLI